MVSRDRSNQNSIFYSRFDYNLKSRSHNVDFYLSTAVPLFTQCYDVLNTGMTEGVYNMMQRNGVFNFAGLPTRFVEHLGSDEFFPW